MTYSTHKSMNAAKRRACMLAKANGQTLYVTAFAADTRHTYAVESDPIRPLFVAEKDGTLHAAFEEVTTPICDHCGTAIKDPDDIVTISEAAHPARKVHFHRTGECGPADENGPAWQRA
jgi:hypothetical protein